MTAGQLQRGKLWEGAKREMGWFAGVCAQGGWALDLKQGLGKKVYANGDVYEGLWRAGKCEGPGRYRWKNRNEYDGEWRAGRMHGRGTLKWNTGGLLLTPPSEPVSPLRVVAPESWQWRDVSLGRPGNGAR